MNLKKLLQGFSNGWVIIGAIVFAITLLVATYAGFLILRGTVILPGETLPTVIVIAGPTATLPVPTSAPSPEPTSTPEMGIPAGGENIRLNGYVQVVGTGGDGLRVRSQPSLSQASLFIAVESEVFLVKDGPQVADGYTWWYLEAPFNPDRKGWAVANYLMGIDNP